jgi:tetratricopeptide (TPR) repeat protein
MTINSPDFKNDIVNLVSTYLNQSDVLEFNQHFLMDSSLKKSGISYISESDKSQLDYILAPSKDRFQIDRTITLAAKKLDKDKYVNLLTNLSELCVSHGMLNLASEIISKIKKENKIKAVYANSQLILADILARKGKWDKSLQTVRSAKKVFNQNNDSLGLAKCSNIIGTIHGERGNLSKAKTYFEESLELAKNEDDKKLVAMLEVNLGIVNNIYENYDEALNYFNEALRKLEELGDLRRIAEVRHNIGMMFKEQKYYHSALQQFDSAISIAIRNEYNPILAISYISKAEILVNLEEFSFAAAISDKAKEVAHILDDKVTIAEVYRLQGKIYKSMQNYKLSENSFMSALRINKKLNIGLNVAECYYELASLYSELDNIEEEKKYLNYSLDYYKAFNAASHVQEIETKLSQISN